MAKKQPKELSKENAQQVLNNVLGACNMPPNTLPLELLEENIKHKRLLTVLPRVLAILAIVAFLILPFLYLEANVNCKVIPQEGNRISVETTVTTLVPVRGVSFTLNGSPLEYSQLNNVYTVETQASGEFVARITTWDGKTVEQTMPLQLPSVVKPSITDHSYTANTFTFTVVQGSFAVDFDGIYAINPAGERQLPSSVDQASGKVVFEQVDSTYNFFIPDIQGNVLQAVLSFHD